MPGICPVLLHKVQPSLLGECNSFPFPTGRAKPLSPTWPRAAPNLTFVLSSPWGLRGAKMVLLLKLHPQPTSPEHSLQIMSPPTALWLPGQHLGVKRLQAQERNHWCVRKMNFSGTPGTPSCELPALKSSTGASWHWKGVSKFRTSSYVGTSQPQFPQASLQS